MHRRRLPLLTCAVSALFITSTLPANSATIAGTKCTKVGATKTDGGKKYTCVKSGKKLIWNKGVAISTGTSAATEAALGARMANILTVQLVADRLWKNSQGLKVEDPIWLTGKNASLANVALGAKAARQMIMSYSPMFANFDMNDLPKEFALSNDATFGKYLQGAHGVGHLANDFYAKTAGGVDPKLIPTWFSEGSAMVIGTMATASYLKNSPNYATIASKLQLDWKSDPCKPSYDKWRASDSADEVATNSCAFGLGQIMVEALVNKSNSIDKINLVYQMVAIGNTFDDALKYSFGITKADFFTEMDSYLASLKW